MSCHFPNRRRPVLSLLSFFFFFSCLVACVCKSLWVPACVWSNWYCESIPMPTVSSQQLFRRANTNKGSKPQAYPGWNICCVCQETNLFSAFSKILSMRQYLICRLKPESHRDQLKRALSIPVLCVLITRVRKTDGFTEKVIRWGYHVRLPLLLPYSPTFSLCSSPVQPLPLLHRVLMDEHTISADYQIHDLIMVDMGEFPYPLDAMPVCLCSR